jgi:hypothetical protein
VDKIERVIEEFRTRYFDFTAKHFHDAIRRVSPLRERACGWWKTEDKLRLPTPPTGIENSEADI